MSSFRALVLVAFLLRWCLALHPHSGYGVTPMRGDFEAQRHWVEVTSHLPRQDWYRNTTDNDLEYWGLDYPPHSAYHARLIYLAVEYIFGWIFLSGSAGTATTTTTTTTATALQVALNTSFGLFTSRGAEDVGTVVIMRLSSLLTDAICYAPAALCIIKDRLRVDRGAFPGEQYIGTEDDVLVSIFFLLAPLPQLFIDHGHFQFNSVPAGLILWVIYLMSRSVLGRRQRQPSDKSSIRAAAAAAAAPTQGTTSPLMIDCLAAFLSGSAVMFKQMSLYYCPGIAVVLLTRCLAPVWWSYADDDGEEVVNATPTSAAFLRLVSCVACGLCGLLLPLAPLSPADVLSRMFPFQRGLYEDKVSNVWCAISPVLKLPKLIGESRDKTVLVCLACTVLSFLPAAVIFCRSVAQTVQLARSERHTVKTANAIALTNSSDASGSGSSKKKSGGTIMMRCAVFPEDALSPSRIAMLLTASSLSFFLFAFQVHEKSILMAVLSTAVVWVTQDSRQPRAPTIRLACAHFMLVAMVSLQPLAVKDKLSGVPWFVFTALCAIASATSFFSPARASAGHGGETAPDPGNVSALYLVSCLTLVGAAVLMPLFVEPTAALPDIVPLANTIVCCAHFCWYLLFWTRELKHLF